MPAVHAQPGDSKYFLDDPHARANDMVVSTRHPTVGQLTVAWRYIQFAETAPTRVRPTPLLGEHTDEVLRELGYPAAEIEALHEDGVVKREFAV